MPVPVISVNQMREWEKATWAEGITEASVIERVGEIIAERVRQLVSAGELVLVLAGKGHNGDDARRARECLSDLRVQLCTVTDPAKDISEIAHWLEQRPALIVDGLFGIGLNRPLDQPWIDLIERVNASHIPVLAVDVPSGLNTDTGVAEGAAINASITLTLGAPKQGMLVPSAWPHVGRLEVAREIGLVRHEQISELHWTLAEDFRQFPPARGAAMHKGDFGHVCLIAGSLGYHGAGVLAARGAQRAQPGLVTLHTQENVYPAVASQLQAVMVHPLEPMLKLPGEYDAILIGPGLAAVNLPDSLKLMTRLAWRDASTPVIIDATALDWLPFASLPKNLVRVVTPHPGEAARLLRASVPQVQANRPNAVREISKRLGNCWVILKGAQTLIGRSTGEIFVNPSGNPQLAQGGSGDVLAGYLAGLLAQKALQTDPLKTIRYGVWQHGIAADHLSRMRKNWVIEDLVNEIGNHTPGAIKLI